MYVKNLKLWNFRKYGNDEEFRLDSPNLNLNFNPDFNVLVGENDSGKSAIIDALKIIFKTHSFEWIRIEPNDFHEQKERLRIEVRLEDLTVEEAKNFIEWLGWIGEGEEAKPYLRLILDVKRNSTTGEIKFYDVKAGVDDEGAILNAEAREYLKTTYLKPLRDAGSELVPRQNSRLSQILQGHHAFKNRKDDHVLVKIFENFNEEITNYFLGEDAEGNQITDQNGKALKAEIDKYIKEFYDSNGESLFEVTSGTLKNILERLELSIKEVINPGLGTLNKLFISSELLHLRKEGWSGLRLGLIEELEAHLHPQSQMRVVEYLQRFSGIQLILTTHSPNLASKINLKNLIVCNDNQAFPMGSEYTNLDQKQYKFLEKFLDVTKADMFFAKGLILVEGWSEEILIPSIARKIGLDLTKYGVSIINVGNLGFANYTNIFLRKTEPFMNIPIAVVTDSDIRPFKVNRTTNTDGNIIESFDNLNIQEFETQTLAKITSISSKDAQCLKHFVSKYWTLEYCLAHSNSLSELFKETAKKVHSHTDWVNFDEVLKRLLNTKNGLKKTEIAYIMASIIDNDGEKYEKSNITINHEDAADEIQYIINAIKYATGN